MHRYEISTFEFCSVARESRLTAVILHPENPNTGYITSNIFQRTRGIQCKNKQTLVLTHPSQSKKQVGTGKSHIIRTTPKLSTYDKHYYHKNTVWVSISCLVTRGCDAITEGTNPTLHFKNIYS